MEDDISAARDHRQFLQELDDEGELLTITKEVDSDVELVAIVRRVYELEERALLFNNLKGCEMLDYFLSLGPRINEAKTKDPTSCQKLLTGSVKEHIIRGDDIDLTALPIPFLHEDDGGKVPREPAGPVIPKQDIGVIFDLWKEKVEDMPWALCFGVPSASAARMVCGMPIPKWTNEPEFISTLTNAPVNVKCETNDLWVPTNAEIVFEGIISIQETAPEGIRPNITDCSSSGRQREWRIFKVNVITY
ncbi:hypothetical protein EYZ11_001683 [Aspergillus tanneri]|uniref:Uncharacterized protein n=1 Tax=Aspergillus tanneri TaxID=1220188 RepID=A0A4S3JSW2_9EURO|nr:hypothetical protein EYZ11_001683 [Aspergillus tanneri]